MAGRSVRRSSRNLPAVVATAQPGDTAVVKARSVAKRWGSTVALADVTVEIGPGVTALLGANGSGKTTLLGLLLGLHPPDGGSIEVLGLDPTRLGPTLRARVGYSPEHHLLPGDVKAVDFVRHIGELHGLPRREAMGRASDVLWQVGLGEERVRPLGTMSTGQRQRVKLAQAIVHDPLLVLLDEPTEGLDPVQRDDMLRLIRRVASRFGLHIVLSSHVLDEVERVADSAVILHAGCVVAAGRLEDLQAGGAGVVVEVDGDVRPLVDRLRSDGATLHWDGRRLFVTGVDDAADVTRDALADLGLGVRRLQPRVRTLEEVFLGAGRTGGQASQASPESPAAPAELGAPGMPGAPAEPAGPAGPATPAGVAAVVEQRGPA
ncbi:MAG: ATP-binding cassette domain-containing protein [Actinobacteria bacterium]|nr:ATP-binding cassette domain-containing protein [Actinomycetota bacterium]